MHNILVLQWSRLGDLLHTRVLLSRLRARSPRAHIVLCCDQQLTPIALDVGYGIDVRPLDLQGIVSLAAHASTHTHALRRLMEWSADVKSRPWDQTIVLSRSLAAVLAAEVLECRELLGFKRHFRGIQDPQIMALIEHGRHEGRVIPVHIADVWADWGDVRGRPMWLEPLANRRHANKPSSKGKKIGIICDAGESQRSLPRRWIGALAESLRRELNGEVVLTGKHTPIASDQMPGIELLPGVHDLRGRTSLAELRQSLEDCSLVIGPDTGALHLAAAVNVPVIGLYFAGAHCAQTGPYAPDAFVIQEPGWSHNTIETIVSLARFRISYGTFPEPFDRNQFVPSLGETGLEYVNRRPMDPVCDLGAPAQKVTQFA